MVALGRMLTTTAWAARTWAVLGLRLVLVHMRQVERWARWTVACTAHPGREDSSADLRLGTSIVVMCGLERDISFNGHTATVDSYVPPTRRGRRSPEARHRGRYKVLVSDPTDR